MPNWTDAQKEAIEARGTNLLVSAAAGSGKTAVMVERIFSLISSGESSIDKMLIVTFTNAAAASMRQKLTAKLEDALTRQPQNENLIRQRQLIDRANISTIHAFCTQLLRRYYFNTKLPPDFRLFDETQYTLLVAAASEQILEEASKRYEDDLWPEYGAALEQFTSGKTDTGLTAVLLALHAFMESLPDKAAYRNQVLAFYQQDKNPWESVLLEHARQLLFLGLDYIKVLAQEYAVTGLDFSAQTYLDKFAAVFESAAVQNTPADMYNTLKQRAPVLKRSDSVYREDFDRCTGVIKKLRTRVQAMLKGLNGDDFSPALPALSALFELEEAFSARLEELMLSEGGTTFSGLLRYTVQLLKEQPEILNDIKENIDYIFVDEYQDVNRMQNHMIEMLAKGDNLFFVGDVKQSIYGFQLARPELFIEKMHAYHDGILGRRINLKNNFRSLSAILEGINFIFENCMFEDTADIEYDADAALAPSPEANGWQSQEGLFVQDKTETENELLVCEGDPENEAEMLASRIQELKGSRLYDPETGDTRPVRYNDIVILGRTRDAGNIFSPVFAAHGIPFTAQAPEKTAGLSDTGVILSLLRLLLMRRSDIDLLTVMSSCIGNFTPTELSLIRSASPEGSFYDAMHSYAGENAELKEKLKNFEAALDRWLLLSRAMALPEFIEYIYNETGYIYHTAYMPGGQQNLEHIDDLIRCAREYTAVNTGGLRGFLTYYENFKSPAAADTAVIDENDDSVHYMTIHKSKGLEFPIVILTGTTRPLSAKPRSAAVLFHEKLGIGFDLSKKDTFGVRTKTTSAAKRAIAVRCAQQEAAEEMRLLYVALTRAKNKLIFSVCTSQKKLADLCYFPHKAAAAVYESYAELLIPLLFSHRDGTPLRKVIRQAPMAADEFIFTKSHWHVNIFNPEEKTAHGDPPSSFPAPAFNSEHYTQQLNHAFTWQYPFAAAVTQRTKQAPSQKDLRVKIPLRRPAFEDKEYTGAQKGTVVHFFMEHVSFSSFKDARSQAEEMVSAGLLSADEFSALPFQQLDFFLQSTMGQRMKSAKELNRERSFCLIIPFKETGDEALVQGIIDCYFFEEDRIVLLDYKTDLFHGSIQEMTLHHRPQLLMYKAALEQLYPGKTVVPYIHFFSQNATIEIK